MICVWLYGNACVYQRVCVFIYKINFVTGMVWRAGSRAGV